MTQRRPVVWIVVAAVAALAAGLSALQLPEAAGDLRGVRAQLSRRRGGGVGHRRNR